MLKLLPRAKPSCRMDFPSTRGWPAVCAHSTQYLFVLFTHCLHPGSLFLSTGWGRVGRVVSQNAFQTRRALNAVANSFWFHVLAPFPFSISVSSGFFFFLLSRAARISLRGQQFVALLQTLKITRKTLVMRQLQVKQDGGR